jgi:16S rRNA (guanine527-N7)-methyltransferase
MAPMLILAEGARALLHLDLTPAQLAAFETYARLLREWNERFNLTGITDDQGLQVKHFLDSLTVLPALPTGAARVADVGTGAGFPGLPLKLIRPELRLTLIEATGKKVTFLEAVIAALNLSGVAVVKARAEEIGQDPAHRERYDAVLARAVAELPVLLEYTLPLARVGGAVIAQKGEAAPAEAETAEAAARRLGGSRCGCPACPTRAAWWSTTRLPRRRRSIPGGRACPARRRSSETYVRISLISLNSFICLPSRTP